MSWTDLTIDNDYQIFTEFPHQIRKKSNGRIVSEYIVGQGYICLLYTTDAADE